MHVLVLVLALLAGFVAPGSAMANEQTKIRQLEVELSEQRKHYTDRHPKVIMIQRALTRLRRSVKERPPANNVVNESERHGNHRTAVRPAQRLDKPMSRLLQPGTLLAFWDFQTSPLDWSLHRDLQVTQSDLEESRLEVIGDDPQLLSPDIQAPASTPLRFSFRMRSSAGPSAQIFYGEQFTQRNSQPIAIRNDGRWHEYTVILPPLEDLVRIRFDPSNARGNIAISWMRLETAPIFEHPLVAPSGMSITDTATGFTMDSGSLTLTHGGRRLGDFALRLDGADFARGHDRDVLGYIVGPRSEWIPLADAKVNVRRGADGSQIVLATLTDPGGAEWRIRRVFRAGLQPGTLAVRVEVSCSADRELIHFPWLTVFAGLNSFGTRKQQGLFAGVEFLADEPSSSTADIAPPHNNRLAPDPLKITIPLMAISHKGRVLGLAWKPSSEIAAVFDSPDRVFGTSAHLLALSAPGIGRLRSENALVPHAPIRLIANTTLSIDATLLGALGPSVTKAVQIWAAVEGWPEVPSYQGGLTRAVDMLTLGWLKSKIHRDGEWGHVSTGRGYKAAADVPAFLAWLSALSSSEAQRNLLTTAASRGLAKLPPMDPLTGGISHVIYPLPPLLFGRAREYVRAREKQGRKLLRGFGRDGLRHYRARSKDHDFGKTHFATHANGFGAGHIHKILEAAALGGDPALLSSGVRLLDSLTRKYAYTVPRGAQTWEISLHAPDILAAAYLVRCFVLGYELTGEERYLEQAVHWAWTGIPFLYLTSPLRNGRGLYASIPDFAATNWNGTLWLGLPVQWCGLVYASALHRLSRHDNSAPWDTIARGITAAGLRMLWPPSNRKLQGLLPDWYDLETGQRNRLSINPGTIQATIPELFHAVTLYDFAVVPRSRFFIHAPGRISALHESERARILRFVVEGWPDFSYQVLVANVNAKPERVLAEPLTPTGKAAGKATRVEIDYSPKQRLLMIPSNGKTRITIISTAGEKG